MTSMFRLLSGRLQILALMAACGILSLTACDTPKENEQLAVSGTVTYLPRIALTPDATIHVVLADANRMDVASRLIADTTFQTNGRQVPVPFELLVDSKMVDPGTTYVLRAEIREADGRLAWTTDSTYPVTNLVGHTEGIELVLTQTGTTNSSTNSGLTGSTWTLASITDEDGESRTPDEGRTYNLELLEDGRVAGAADCNRFGGTYDLDDSFRTSQMTSTMAACNDGWVSDAFIKALSEATSVQMEDDMLTIGFGDGGVLSLRRDDASQEKETEDPMLAQKVGETFVFDCVVAAGDTTSFTVKTGPGELAVWLPERFNSEYLVLGQTRAASGARYEGDDVIVWTHGDTASIEVKGQSFSNCASNHRKAVWEKARLAGVTFRGLGNEPFWRLDIVRDQEASIHEPSGLLLTAQVARDEGASDATRYKGMTESGELVIDIIDRSCQDTMSGEEFSATVEIQYGDRSFAGCGRWLD